MNKKSYSIYIIYSMFIFILSFVFIIFPVKASSYKDSDTKKIEFPFDELLINTWQEVEKGLSFNRISETIMIERENNAKLPVNISFDVLRFDPDFFEFSVYGVTIDKTVKRSLYGWLRDYNLLAVINASMYLPDNISSIGYLKKKNKYSNSHIGKNLGAFFLANPYEKYKGKIPNVAIIYSNEPHFSRFIQSNEKQKITTVLDKYQVVVQNFQLLELTNNDNHVWSGQRRHSIASLGEDAQGRILLMYASNPITINEFILALRKSKQLNIKRAMYLEGGTEAAMLYQGQKTFLWQVNDNIKLFLKGIILLPNVIGIKRK